MLIPKPVPLACRFVLCVALFFAAPVFGFAQEESIKTLSELGALHRDLVKDLGGLGGQLASMGLDWSVPYIGELITLPPNYGFGGIIGLQSIELININKLLTAVQAGLIKASIGNQLLTPMYFAELRIGGPRLTFSDIGVKAGIVPVFPLGGVTFNNFALGADIRFSFLESLILTRVSMGAEIAYASGALSVTGTTGTLDSDNPSLATSWKDSDLELFWDTLDIIFKINGAQEFPTFIIFINLDLGLNFSSAGYRVIGGDIKLAGTVLASATSSERTFAQTSAEQQAGYGTFTLGSDRFEAKSSMFGLDPLLLSLRATEGVSFKLGDLYLDTAVTVDFWNLSFGFNVSVRYLNLY